MTLETFASLNNVERDKVVRYISIHTIHSYADIKHVSDCFMGIKISLIHPLAFLRLATLINDVPESYNEYFDNE